MEDIHSHCNLRDKTPAELTQICQKAVADKDMTQAYHCAMHHMRTCHAGIDKNQIEFFAEHLPGVIEMGKTSVKHLSEQLDEHLRNQETTALEGAPFQMKMAAGLIRTAITADIRTVAMLSYLTGVQLSAYVTSQGEGCLFSLIDPELCRRAV